MARTGGSGSTGGFGQRRSKGSSGGGGAAAPMQSSLDKPAGTLSATSAQTGQQFESIQERKGAEAFQAGDVKQPGVTRTDVLRARGVLPPAQKELAMVVPPQVLAQMQGRPDLVQARLRGLNPDEQEFVKQSLRARGIPIPENLRPSAEDRRSQGLERALQDPQKARLLQMLGVAAPTIPSAFAQVRAQEAQRRAEAEEKSAQRKSTERLVQTAVPIAGFLEEGVQTAGTIFERLRLLPKGSVQRQRESRESIAKNLAQINQFVLKNPEAPGARRVARVSTAVGLAVQPRTTFTEGLIPGLEKLSEFGIEQQRRGEARLNRSQGKEIIISNGEGRKAQSNQQPIGGESIPAQGETGRRNVFLNVADFAVGTLQTAGGRLAESAGRRPFGTTVGTTAFLLGPGLLLEAGAALPITARVAQSAAGKAIAGTATFALGTAPGRVATFALGSTAVRFVGGDVQAPSGRKFTFREIIAQEAVFPLGLEAARFGVVKAAEVRAGRLAREVPLEVRQAGVSRTLSVEEGGTKITGKVTERFEAVFKLPGKAEKIVPGTVERELIGLAKDKKIQQVARGQVKVEGQKPVDFDEILLGQRKGKKVVFVGEQAAKIRGKQRVTSFEGRAVINEDFTNTLAVVSGGPLSRQRGRVGVAVGSERTLHEVKGAKPVTRRDFAVQEGRRVEVLNVVDVPSIERISATAGGFVSAKRFDDVFDIVGLPGAPRAPKKPIRVPKQPFGAAPSESPSGLELFEVQVQAKPIVVSPNKLIADVARKEFKKQFVAQNVAEANRLVDAVQFVPRGAALTQRQRRDVLQEPSQLFSFLVDTRDQALIDLGTGGRTRQRPSSAREVLPKVQQVPVLDLGLVAGIRQKGRTTQVPKLKFDIVQKQDLIREKVPPPDLFVPPPSILIPPPDIFVPPPIFPFRLRESVPGGSERRGAGPKKGFRPSLNALLFGLRGKVKDPTGAGIRFLPLKGKKATKQRVESLLEGTFI